MKLTVRDLDLSQLSISEEQLRERTPGIHVSSIIRHIKAQLNPERNDFSADDLEWFAVVGRLWEKVLADNLFPRPRYERIGEIEYEGIIGSPDCIDTEEWAVLEFKVCYKSSRDFENSQRFREYKWQILSYMQMMGMVRGRLLVFFIAGEWRPPIPKAFEWDIVATTAELKANWDMIKREGESLARM